MLHFFERGSLQLVVRHYSDVPSIASRGVMFVSVVTRPPIFNLSTAGLHTRASAIVENRTPSRRWRWECSRLQFVVGSWHGFFNDVSFLGKVCTVGVVLHWGQQVTILLVTRRGENRAAMYCWVLSLNKDARHLQPSEARGARKQPGGSQLMARSTLLLTSCGVISAIVYISCDQHPPRVAGIVGSRDGSGRRTVIYA